MPNFPTARSLHVNTLLTDFAIAHGQAMTDYVADVACTIVDTDKKSNNYAVWSKADMFRDDMKEWADGASASSGGQRVDTTSIYTAKRWALKSLLTKNQRAQARGELDVEQAKVRYLMQQAKMRRDKIFRDVAFATGLWTANTEQDGVAAAPGANQFLRWDDAASTPIEDITNGMLTVQASTGRMPNVGIIDPDTNNALKQHADIVDRFKHTQKGIITEDLLAALFGLDEWVVFKAVENTANEESTDTATMARVPTDGLLLVHRTPSMSQDEPTAMALFSFSEFDFVTPEGAAIESWFDEEVDGDWFRASQYFDIQITSNDLGLFFDTPIAP